MILSICILLQIKNITGAFLQQLTMVFDSDLIYRDGDLPTAPKFLGGHS